MNYLSLTFAGFVLLLAAVYYGLPKSARWITLLCASLIFYACSDVRYFWFLLFTAATTFSGAVLLEKTKKKKLVLVCCIALNAALWLAVKELPWVLKSIGRAAQMLGAGCAIPEWSVIVPVGISYYILQAIGYLVDVSKGKIVAERNFLKYLLFLSWFPAIVQGPISRYEELMPQLLNTKQFSFERIRDSLVLILFGLVKKMVVADRLGIFVNNIFSQYEDLYGVILYIGAVGYAIQLYLDFSGCVDICRGVSGLFGVELMHNFNRPYQSRSIQEFWNRWHMSLSGWLKDYVYIPLGGNRKGQARKYLNLLITFLVSGLWHGAGFNYFLWGAMHAAFQTVGQCTSDIRRKFRKLIGIKEGSASERIYQTLITFNLVTLAWIVFRAGGLMSGIRYIWHMISESAVWVLFDGSLYNYGLSQSYIVFLLIHICILFIVELCTKRQEDVVAGLTRQHIFIRWTIYYALIFDVLLFGVYGSGYDMASFMYGGF